MTTPSTSLQARQHTQTHGSETSFRWLIILLAIVAASLLGLYFMNFNGGFGNQGDFGAFGDFLGGVLNPILGFATVGLLIWSLKLQMNELSLSRQELALTRQELAETKAETALSRKAMQDQVKHLEKEAQLNELTRLLERSQHKFEIMISKEFPLRYLTLPDSSRINLNETYQSLLDFTLLNVDHFTAKAISDMATSHPNIRPKLNNLRKEAILFSDLALKYYSINKSHEFARAYLLDAHEFIQTVSRIYPDEITQDRITIIATIMMKYMDVAKVPSTD